MEKLITDVLLSDASIDVKYLLLSGILNFKNGFHIVAEMVDTATGQFMWDWNEYVMDCWGTMRLGDDYEGWYKQWNAQSTQWQIEVMTESLKRMLKKV